MHSTGCASIVLPLRHPAHIAKAAASVDALSGGRLILGVASGVIDQKNIPHSKCPLMTVVIGFVQALNILIACGKTDAPTFENPFGNTHGDMDMLPKTTAGKLPLLITGGSQQDPHLDALNPQKVEALIKTIKKVLVELR